MEKVTLANLPHYRDSEDERTHAILQELYTWIDKIPLSKPKKNISRDFADGVSCAEVMKYFYPKWVEMNNYVSASATEKKKTNWSVLNSKVFKKLGFNLADDVVNDIIAGTPNFIIERVLIYIKLRIELEKQNCESDYSKPEADQSAPQGKGKGGKQTQKTVGSKKAAGNSKNVQVPLLTLEEKEQEILAKEETIQILQAKVRRLDHLLHLKDIRIDDLQARQDDASQSKGKTKRY